MAATNLRVVWMIVIQHLPVPAFVRPDAFKPPGFPQFADGTLDGAIRLAKTGGQLRNRQCGRLAQQAQYTVWRFPRRFPLRFHQRFWAVIRINRFVQAFLNRGQDEFNKVRAVGLRIGSRQLIVLRLLPALDYGFYRQISHDGLPAT